MGRRGLRSRHAATLEEHRVAADHSCTGLPGAPRLFRRGGAQLAVVAGAALEVPEVEVPDDEVLEELLESEEVEEAGTLED